MNGLANRLTRLFKGNRNARAFQFYSLIRYLGLLLSSIALARLFPDKSLIADYERLLLLGGSVTFFWTGGLMDAFVVLFKEAEGKSQRETLSALNGLALGLGLLSGVTVLVLGQLMYGGEMEWNALLAYAVFIAADSYAIAVVYFMLVKGRAGEMVVFGLLAYAGYFMALVLMVKEGGLGNAMLGLAVLAVGKAVYCGIRFGTAGGFFTWNTRSTQLLALGAPLGLAALLSYSATYLDSYLVEEFFPEDFANFRYGAKELPLVLLLANSLSIVQSGEVSEAIGKGKVAEALAALKAGSLRLMHLLFPISTLLLFASDLLFEFAFGPAFAGAVLIFDIYLLLVIPRLLFPQSALRGYKHTRLMGRSAAIELAANVALSLLGLYLFGIAGIAAATVIAYLLEKAILIFYCKNQLQLSFSQYTPGGWWTAYSLLILAAFALKYAFLV